MNTTTYEISTPAELKAAIFDAIEKGVVLDQSALVSFKAFDDAVDAYIEMCRDAGPNVIASSAYPTAQDLMDRFTDLTADAQPS